MFKTAPPPKLASPGETLLAVWSLFLSHWRALLRISVYQCVTLAFTLPAVLYVFGRFDPTGEIVVQAAPNPTVYIALLLISAAGSAAMAGLLHPALITVIYLKLVGKDLPMAKGFARSKEVFWRYLLVFAGMAASVGFLSFVPLIGFLLAIAAGMFLMFSVQAVVLEDLGVIHAFKRSVGLVRGRFWAVLWRFLAVAGVIAVAATVVSFLFVWKPMDLLEIHLMPVFIQKRYLLLFTALGTAVSIVVLPFFLIIQTIFYAELRKHKTPST